MVKFLIAGLAGVAEGLEKTVSERNSIKAKRDDYILKSGLEKQKEIEKQKLKDARDLENNQLKVEGAKRVKEGEDITSVYEEMLGAGLRVTPGEFTDTVNDFSKDWITKDNKWKIKNGIDTNVFVQENTVTGEKKFKNFAGTKESDKDKQKRELIERGYAPNDASDVVNGRVEVIVNPVSQVPTLVNVLTKEARPLIMVGEGDSSIGMESAPAELQTSSIEPTTPTTISQEMGGKEPVVPVSAKTKREALALASAQQRMLKMIEALPPEAGEATGVISNMSAAVDSIVGFLTGGTIDKDNQIARQELTSFGQQIRSALRSGPKLLAKENEEISKMIPSPTDFFSNPETSKTRLAQLGRLLQAAMDSQMAIATGESQASSGVISEMGISELKMLDRDLLTQGQKRQMIERLESIKKSR